MTALERTESDVPAPPRLDPVERTRRAAGPLLVFFLVGASVGLAFFVGLFAPDRSAFLLGNGVELKQRTAGLLGSLTLGLLLALGAFVRAGGWKSVDPERLTRGRVWSKS